MEAVYPNATSFEPTGSESRSELTEEHRREVEEGSGVAAHIRAMRGYRTVGAKEARSLSFAESQARDGLLIPFYSPTGEISYQLKPDQPRIDDGKPVKYETRAKHDIVLDVHPSNYPRLLNGDDPILVTEGIKKADCAASSGRLAVGLSGTWNWGRKRERGGAKYGRPELLRDWDAIPLEGRTVYVCFDSDYREKQGVALAMLRLGERLTERGAHVYVMSLTGPEKGLDDFVIAGGDLDRLEREARPFTPSNLIPYAAKRDKRVWAIVGSTSDAMRTDDWTGRGDSTTHSLLRTLQELALLGGRYDREEGAVEVMMGTRELRAYAAIGSKSTLTKHTARLEERGYVKKVTGDRKKGRANRYLLKLSKGVPVIERGKEVSNISIPGTPPDIFAPHLRWPGPASADRTSIVEQWHSKLPDEDEEDYEPENPYHLKPEVGSIYDEEDEDTPEVAEHAELEVALGKKVEMALHLLATWGGETSLRDLSTATGVNHTAKMRNKLEAAGGVFDLDPKGKHGARVRLAEDWERRLDAHRERAGEMRRARQQAVKNREARERFRREKESPTEATADKETNLLGRERVDEMVDEAEKREREARVEEQRRKVGTTPETFLADALQDNAGFGWRELRALWMAKGGRPEDLRRAVKHPYCFQREHDGGPLYVERIGQAPEPEREPAPVRVLRDPEPKMPEKNADGIYHHGAFCNCHMCDAPHQARYARPRSGA